MPWPMYPSIGMHAGRDRHVLDGRADVVEPARGGEGGDARPQRGARGVAESDVCRVGVVAEHHGDGAVAVPAVDDGAAIDRDHVAVGQDARAGDAVHHLVIHGDAGGRREAVIAEEVGRGSPFGDHARRRGVDVRGGRADDGGLASRGERGFDHDARARHDGHLRRGLVLDAHQQ